MIFMKSLNDILRDVQAALLAVTNACYHYRRPPKPAESYIVWAEDREAESMESENRTAEQQIHGTIDYFTRTEFDVKVDQIQEALNTVEGCAFHYEGAQFEEDTNLIHSSWECEVI